MDATTIPVQHRTAQEILAERAAAQGGELDDPSDEERATAVTQPIPVQTLAQLLAEGHS